MKRILGLLFVLAIQLPAFADSRGTYVSAQSMGASFNGGEILVKGLSTLTLQVFVASCSSCDGIVKLQASNVASPGSSDWTDIPATSKQFTADGNHMYEISMPGYYKARLVYTRTAGTGTMNVYSVAKDLR